MNRQSGRHATRDIGDNWRRWIAENLMLGSAPDTLKAILTGNGIAPDQASREIASALRSPYLQGASRLVNRLAKRNWVLAIEQQLNQLNEPGIERRERLSGEAFMQQFYRQNRPVIITGMLEHFPARTRWTLPYFAQRFGERTVEVQMNRSADAQYEMNSIAHKRSMPFGEYVEMIRQIAASNDFYMTANNDSRNRAALRELWDDLGELPDYLDESAGRQGFFWFGPRGTITPLHHDLTNNFMQQIVGRKRVYLAAPCESARIYNTRHCFSEVDASRVDLARFPAMAGVPIMECVLAPGEILFLPVGWWHQVEALDISVTVAATNFRWPNDFYTNYPANHDF